MPGRSRRARSRCGTSARISSARGSITSASARRESWCGGAAAEPGDLDRRSGDAASASARAVALLQALGLGERRAQRGREVVGDVAAADRQDGGVADRPAVADDDVDVVPPPMSISATPSSRSSGVSTASAAASGPPSTSCTWSPARLQHLMRFCPELIGAGHDVDARLEPHPGHADRLLDAVLVVDDELLRQDVEHLAVRRAARPRGPRRSRARRRPARDLAVLHRHHAVAVEALDVAARPSPRPRCGSRSRPSARPRRPPCGSPRRWRRC